MVLCPCHVGHSRRRRHWQEHTRWTAESDVFALHLQVSPLISPCTPGSMCHLGGKSTGSKQTWANQMLIHGLLFTCNTLDGKWINNYLPDWVATVTRVTAHHINYSLVNIVADKKPQGNEDWLQNMVQGCLKLPWLAVSGKAGKTFYLRNDTQRKLFAQGSNGLIVVFHKLQLWVILQ